MGDFITSIALVVENSSASSMTGQTGRLIIANAETGKKTTFHLGFLAYNPATGDLFLSSSDVDALRITPFRKVIFNATSGRFSVNYGGSVLPLNSSSGYSLPVGYHCLNASNRELCLLVPSNSTGDVTIDLTGQSAKMCNGLSVKLSSPLWTLDLLPDCLLGPVTSIFAVLFDFATGNFGVTWVGPRGFSFGETAKSCYGNKLLSGLQCIAIGTNVYAGQVVGNTIQLASYDSSARVASQAASFGIPCNVSASDGSLVFSKNSIGSWGMRGISDVYLNKTGLVIQTTGSASVQLSSDLCHSITYQLSPIVRYSGDSDAGTPLFATLIIDSTRVTPTNPFSDITVKISLPWSTRLLCSLYSNGIVVVGGPVLFLSPPQGTCDDTTANAVNFSVTMSVNGFITVSLKGNTSYDGVTISGMVTNDDVLIPTGRYCADLGNGDFVMVQQNRNGTTTMYATLDGLPSSGTMWYDQKFEMTSSGLDDGFALRLTDVIGSVPFSIVSINTTGYGLRVVFPRSLLSLNVLASPQACNAASIGRFCGVNNTVGSQDNSSFAVLSLEFDKTTLQYSTSLYASRRVSNSLPVNVTFNDHPWLLPFFAPVSIVFNDKSRSWTVSFHDELGPMTVTMTSESCGSAATSLPNDTYCGSALTTGDKSNLQVFVSVDSRVANGTAVSVTMKLVNVSNINSNYWASSLLTVAYATVIGSQLWYWRKPWQLTFGVSKIISATSASPALLNLDGLYSGVLSPTSCAAIPTQQYYCGINGSVAWALLTQPNGFWLATGTGNGFTRITGRWSNPVTAEGYLLGLVTYPDEQGLGNGFAIPFMRYFATNDSFSLTTDGALAPVTTVSLSPKKCSVTIPNGDYWI